MSRVNVRRLALIVLSICVALFLVANILLTLNICDHQQYKDLKESRIQTSSIRHVHKSKQFVHNRSKTRAPSENVVGVKKEEPIIVNNPVDEFPLTDSSVIEQISSKEISPDECPTIGIVPKKQPLVPEGKGISCQPHKASADSCRYTAELYKFDRDLLECKDKTSYKFCTLNNQNEIKCSFPNFCSSIQVDGVDPKSGDYAQFASYERAQDAVKGIPDVFHNVSKSAFKFMFIICKRSNHSIHSQQLVPAILLPTSSPFKMMHTRSININIILLDSLSRPHFYRSLPLLIKEFNRINRHDDSHGEVLDFTSFQSLHGHTSENVHALFTGTFLPENMTEREKERAYVGIDSLYGKFKNAGYTTMYQDDLCWKEYWGMRLELGFPKSWESMLKRIKASNIDDTGLALANCRILKSLGLKHPFARVSGDQLCFNGEFQHNYLLEKVLNWHTNSRRPTISYTALNVPHDSQGLRTQTLNRGLIKLVRKSLMAGNTITILLADHGNTYTPYIRETLEGRFEMYHPSLFMILPDAVAKLLGEDTMNVLRANQPRLLTMMDIHYGLHAIADFSAGNKMPERRGIFGVIPPDRTCDDLHLVLPNLCVCEGWDNVAKNGSHQLSVLEFAVGFLNNEIEEQRQAGLNINSGIHGNRTKKRRCNHLVPLYFKNVRERNWGENLITTFDFVVSAGSAANQLEDVFHVEVKSSITPGTLVSYIELLSFDRLSPFEPYRKCADTGVDARLCVCSLGRRETAKNGVNYVVDKSVKVVTNYMPSLGGLPSKKILYNRKRDKCIYLVARNYHEYSDNGEINKNNIPSAALEAMNICADRSFVIRMKINVHLMKVSREKIFSAVLHGNTLTFLCALVTENWSWNSRYSFEYTVEPQ